VQAPQRSGALITAEYALEQGRDLCVHAEGLAGSAGAGTRALAESGAPVIGGSAECLAEWGLSPSVRPSPMREISRMRLPGEEIGPALARRLRAEIDGSCALQGGEAYWRE
jgi:DNA processing protein